jgi:putative FmdB family regulatory protein
MPIYAYRCAACGHSRDVLQKLSDAPLTICSACGAEQFSKQVTAAGFQLKGSGWYATDFRNGNAGAGTPAKTDDGASGGTPASTEGGGAAASGGDSASAKASAGSAPAATSGGGTACGGSCACH